MRSLRYLVYTQDGGWTTVEITARTLQGRFLLKPDETVNRIIVGVLARAAERFGVEINADVFLSGHFHLLVSVQSCRSMSRFMQYVMSPCNGGGPRRHSHRRERKLEERSEQEYRQKDRPISRMARQVLASTVHSHRNQPRRSKSRRALRLHLAAWRKRALGCKPLRLAWPPLCQTPCSGSLAPQWLLGDDHTKAFRLKNAGKRVRTNEIRTQHRLLLHPLRCWKHKDRKEICNWVRERLAQIEEEFRHQPVLGVKAILAQPIEEKPKNIKRTCAPRVHARDPQTRKEMREAYRLFVRLSVLGPPS